jgi:hypothetical protein
MLGRERFCGSSTEFRNIELRQQTLRFATAQPQKMQGVSNLINALHRMAYQASTVPVPPVTKMVTLVCLGTHKQHSQRLPDHAQ